MYNKRTKESLVKCKVLFSGFWSILFSSAFFFVLQEIVDKDGNSRLLSFTIPSLSKPSIYHEVRLVIVCSRFATSLFVSFFFSSFLNFSWFYDILETFMNLMFWKPCPPLMSPVTWRNVFWLLTQLFWSWTFSFVQFFHLF